MKLARKARTVNRAIRGLMVRKAQEMAKRLRARDRRRGMGRLQAVGRLRAAERLQGAEPLRAVGRLQAVERLQGAKPLQAVERLRAVEPLQGAEPLRVVEPLQAVEPLRPRKSPRKSSSQARLHMIGCRRWSGGRI